MKTRVFLPSGKVAHVLGDSQSPNSSVSAMCGRSPWPELWHGTGTQSELEKAEQLPLCMGCVEAIRKD